MSKIQRILVDCSFIDFSQQPTGIPRVVVNYIEEGRKWGKEKNIEVVPVLPTSEGIFICNTSATEQDVERGKTSPLQNSIPIIVIYLFDIMTALLQLCRAILPVSLMDMLLEIWKGFAEKGTKKIRLVCKRSKESLATPSSRDVLFCPAYWHDVDPKVYRDIAAQGTRIVVLVHDILPISHPKFYPSPWKYKFLENVLQTTTYASAIYCVSNFTKDCLAEFLVRRKRKLPPLRTAYNGFEPLVGTEGQSLIRNAGGIPQLANPAIARLVRERRPYVMVGSIEPKKGHLPTVQCFESMWGAGLERDLVIVGREGWMANQIVKSIENSLYFGERLHWFTNIDDFDLADVYIHSRALIFSSIAEGFGIPLVEAAHYGKPAIVFDSQIAREIVGEKGFFFHDAASLVRRIIEFEDQATYDAASKKAGTLQWPSWEVNAPRLFEDMLSV